MGIDHMERATSLSYRVIVTSLLIVLGLNVNGTMAPGVFHRLDSLIDAQPRLVAAKEQRLAAMKAELRREKTPGGRYDTMMKLYDEYAAYQYDSAYAYVTSAIRVAASMADVKLLNESRLGLAHILSTACLMDKAQQTLSSIDTALLTPDQLIQYHRTQTDLYIYQAEYMQGTQYGQEYIQQLIDLRRRITGIDVPPGNVHHLLTVAECHADNREPRQAIDLLQDVMRDYHSGQRLYSIITSMISFYYSQMGDQQEQMRYLVKSAESDLEG